MPHPLQMLHGNHSVKVKVGIKVMKLVESLIGWEVTVDQWQDSPENTLLDCNALVNVCMRKEI